MRHPWPAALSAALCLAGFGLLLWLGLAVALVSHSASMPSLRAVQLWSLLAAFALLASAAAIALFGPGRADNLRTRLRAPTRWHARRNLLALSAIATAALVGALLGFVAPGATRAALLGIGGLLLALSSLGAVASGAMVPGDAGDDPPSSLLLPIRLLSAMLGGLALMFALMAGLLAVGRDGVHMFATLMLLGLLLAVTMALHWRTRAPHPDGRLSTRRRTSIIALLAGVPLLALGCGMAGIGAASIWLWLVVAAAIAGVFLAHHVAVPAPGEASAPAT